MVGIIILCVIGVVLSLLLFTPAYLRVRYDQGDVSVQARFGPVLIPIYPRPEQKEQKKKRKKRKEKKKTDDEETKKKPLRFNKEQILYSLEKLPPILGRAFKRIGQRIRIEPLKIHLLVAGKDPADTAVLYGKLEAALAGGLPTLHRLVHIREQDIQLFLDFQEEQMDCIADIGVRIRGWDILVVGLFAGVGVLKWFLGLKKLADTDNKKDEKKDN